MLKGYGPALSRIHVIKNPSTKFYKILMTYFQKGMPQVDRYYNIIICCNVFVSKISVNKFPKLHTKVPRVGSDAKNALPPTVNSISSWAESVGFFWMFIDNPWRIRYYAEYLKRRIKNNMPKTEKIVDIPRLASTTL
jgi:hypothetical protein